MNRKISLKVLYSIAVCAVAVLLFIFGYREFSRQATQDILPNEFQYKQ